MKKKSEEMGKETARSTYGPPKMSWSRRGVGKRISRHETE